MGDIHLCSKFTKKKFGWWKSDKPNKLDINFLSVQSSLTITQCIWNSFVEFKTLKKATKLKTEVKVSETVCKYCLTPWDLWMLQSEMTMDSRIYAFLSCNTKFYLHTNIFKSSRQYIEKLPKAQRTRGLSSYHKFLHKYWSNFDFRILIKH